MANSQLPLVAGVATIGLGGWVGFRLYVRQKTEERLSEKLQDVQRRAGQLSAFGIDLQSELNLPTQKELAESMVPIFSFIMPKQAWADISSFGRNSVYWPSEYRNPAVRPSIEAIVFAELGKGI